MLFLAAEFLHYTNYKPSEIMSDHPPSFLYDFV